MMQMPDELGKAEVKWRHAEAHDAVRGGRAPFRVAGWVGWVGIVTYQILAAGASAAVAAFDVLWLPYLVFVIVWGALMTLIYRSGVSDGRLLADRLGPERDISSIRPEMGLPFWLTMLGWYVCLHVPILGYVGAVKMPTNLYDQGQWSGVLESARGREAA